MATQIKNLDLRAMLRQFGVVTVMDVDVYKAVRYIKDDASKGIEEGEWDSANTFKGDKLFSLKTLKIANINTEGPTKTATGGQNADVLLKYGKTFTIEMQDALGKYEVLENIYGVQSNATEGKVADIIAVTDRFPGELTLVGKTFVIDKATGAKQPIYIVIPLYLGDGIFNLTQDAEGDISVFDMNGNILRYSNGSAAASLIDDAPIDRGALYDKGADNQFYFFATKEAMDKMLAAEPQSYEAVWGAPKNINKEEVVYKWVDPEGTENVISSWPVTDVGGLDFYKEAAFTNKITLKTAGQLVKADFDDNDVTTLFGKAV